MNRWEFDYEWGELMNISDRRSISFGFILCYDNIQDLIGKCQIIIWRPILSGRNRHEY
jgi:hypothetical protein